jgi:WD40 repeat protein
LSRVTVNVNGNPYHVRLSVSQYGDRLRAELFTEDLGDTEGEFLPAKWQAMEEWLSYLAHGTTHLPPDSARAIGKELFTYLLGGSENSKKWTEILEQVKRQRRSLRLLIDAPTERVRDLPYGLLCEPHDDYFLLRGVEHPTHQPIQLVRILRRCTPRLLNLNRHRLRILLVAAEPVSEWLPPFGCAARLRELVSALIPSFDVYVLSREGPRLLSETLPDAGAMSSSLFETFCCARREDLKDALARCEVDILHVIGHGQDGGLVLCDESKGQVSVAAGQLGEWCSTSTLQMAFLQVCEAGKTSGRGSFGGLAQQLINPKCGNLAAAIASSYPLDALGSTRAAINFYRGIAQRLSPDLALERNLDEQDWSWAFLELWVRPRALGGGTNRGAFQFACPYRGLERFEERNSDIFFGRDAETAELLQLLEGESMIAVVGDTGSGKSSLLQAGVASTIRRKGLLGKNDWEIMTVEPGGNLRERLIAALASGAEKPAHAASGREQTWPDVLSGLLRGKCGEGRSLLLIIDQFEEVFTLGENEAELRRVCDVLAGFAMRHHQSFRMILGMRTEYLGAAITIRGLSKAVSRPSVLSPPATNDLLNIVAQPAKQYGYTFEESLGGRADKESASLLSTILSDPILSGATEGGARPERGFVVNPLPLLEFALERLWLLSVARGSQEFTHEDYEKLGGLGGAIVKHAEGIYGRLPVKFGPSAQTIARVIFTNLVSAGGTRRPRSRDELEALTGVKDLTRDIINYLVGERLLAIRSNPDNLSVSHVDLIHEVLIKRWKRFSRWLTTDPARRALIESFEADAKKWSGQGRDASKVKQNFLPGHYQAKQYVAWVDETKPPLSEDQQQFVRALRRMLNLRRLILGGATTLILGALLAAIFFGHESRVNMARRLQQQAVIAINNKEMLEAELYSAQALLFEGEAGERLKLRELLLEARSKGAALDNRIGFKGEFLDADSSHNLILTKNPAGELRLFESATGKETSLDVREERISHAALSSDGSLLAYGTEDGEAKVLRIADRRGIRSARFLAAEDSKVTLPVESVAFSPDTRLLAVGDHSGDITILNLGDGSEKKLKGHREPAENIAFSPDGRLLVSASSDDTVRLWDVDAAKEVRPLVGHEDVVNAVAFSPTGMQVASGASDGAVRVWDVTRPDSEPKILTRPAGAFVALSFSPNGRLLAAAGEDETIRLFDLESNQEILKINSFDGEAKKLFFTQDSRKLFVAHKKVATIWTVVKDKEVRTLLAEESGALSSVAFSPDGRLLAAASHDSNIYIWDFRKKETVKVINAAQRGRLNCVAYSPDGSVLASAAEKLGDDETVSPVRLWDVNNGYQEIKYWDVNNRDEKLKHGGYPKAGVQMVVFSPTGEPIIATAGGYNDDVKVWNYRSKEILKVIPYGKEVWSIAFSPDGQFVAVGGDDGSVRVVRFRDLKDGGTLPPPLYSHKNGVWGLAFSPVQPLLASGSVDKTVRVRNLNDNTENNFPSDEEDELSGGTKQPRHNGSIFSVTFDPAGDWLATAGADHTVTLSNLKNKESLILRMHSRPVWWVAFSRDGSWLASCALDRRVQVWDMREINSVYNSDPAELLRQARAETGLDIEDGKIVLGHR